MASKPTKQQLAQSKARAGGNNPINVKPPAKTKPKPPNPSQIEYRFGMGNNRMIANGVSLEGRVSAGGSRRDAIAESKLTGKPIKDTKPKLTMEKNKPLNKPKSAARVRTTGGISGGGTLRNVTR